MKKNLEILEFENKATNTEPPKIYTRFQTNEGWMSCFNPKEVEELKKFKGKTVCVETRESIANKGTERERVFQNIEKCHGPAERLEPPEYVDKEEEEKVEVVKMNPNSTAGVVKINGQGAMYTSYAKDVFCALITDPNFRKELKEDANELMTTAINIIKQAKEAFE